MNYGSEQTKTASKRQDFARRFSALRKCRNWTQAFVAGKLGLSNRTICKWESGHGVPTFGGLLALSELFDVSLDELVGNRAEVIS